MAMLEAKLYFESLALACGILTKKRRNDVLYFSGPSRTWQFLNRTWKFHWLLANPAAFSERPMRNWKRLALEIKALLHSRYIRNFPAFWKWCLPYWKPDIFEAEVRQPYNRISRLPAPLRYSVISALYQNCSTDVVYIFLRKRSCFLDYLLHWANDGLKIIKFIRSNTVICQLSSTVPEPEEMMHLRSVSFFELILVHLSSEACFNQSYVLPRWCDFGKKRCSYGKVDRCSSFDFSMVTEGTIL